MVLDPDIRKYHEPSYGKKFPMPDVERIGIFAEMPYMHGEQYVPIYSPPCHFTGTNFIGIGPKIKAGLADCYFDKEYKRIFEGEAIKKNKLKKLLPFQIVKITPILVPGPTKWHSTPGDWYGCFSDFPYMSFKAKKTKRLPPEKKNFLTKPGRKGNSGYANICMNPYPKHSEDKYGDKGRWKVYGKKVNGPMVTNVYPQPYFDSNPYKLPSDIPFGKTYIKPAKTEPPFLGPGIIKPIGPGKELAGCKCGGFSKYPAHSTDKHFTVWDLNRPKKLVGTKWNAHATGFKTLYFQSIVGKNVTFRLNERTLTTYEPTYTKYLWD
ncbi:unnamed protein product [Phyllotreta striolata]|uniref:Cilia-and flagella-associated protein 96 n=1 Tax=Phyllotreta striolata TaxID=444603 RepID=A0A9N9TLS7_PHYSR|nr:unnamed protein product [Phyllotreta striolata]